MKSICRHSAATVVLVLMPLSLAFIRADDYHTAQAPLPPEQAAATMRVPEGFHVTLFAGEPDIVQPVSFCIDDRGRLWVAEAYSYPVHSDKPGRDRILIFEDTDGDGRHDKRTVFFEGLNYVTGIEVGFGGVWVMSPPYFLFIADRDGNDVPDGLEAGGGSRAEGPGSDAELNSPAVEVLLDGFGNHANAHNLANGFAWGPDGWLYGTHGRTNWSKIGKPGTPDDQRIVFDGGVYRFHPVTRAWEPYADGTTNPWGIDWDDYGEAFVCNCVNPHLFHVIPGAHYEPWRNRESSRYAYGRIDTIADHLHFSGIANVRDGLGSHREDELGGGHAHCGTMVYLGDNWPDEYRNTVFMNNIHGRRINNDILKRKGSGYTASHGADILRSQDPWFMGVTLAYGPDGSVFVSDWSDTGECHSTVNTRRETGRIYRIAYGTPRRSVGDITKISNLELVDLQLHKNDWYVRHARRLLQERAAAGQDLGEVHASLNKMLVNHPDVTRKLRALWTLHVTGGTNPQLLATLLDHDAESVRAWAVTLLSEERVVTSPVLGKFVELASAGTSPLVRLHLACALQRLKPAQAWPVAEALVTRAEDADDSNLPLMYWYGIEPLVHDDLVHFALLASQAQIPLIREHIGRRLAELSPNAQGLSLLTGLFTFPGDPQKDAAVANDVLRGMLGGLEGQRAVGRPDSWRIAYRNLMDLDDPAVRDQATRLALIFDDPEALAMLRSQALDEQATLKDRTRAINALVSKHVAGFDSQLLRLLNTPAIRPAAIRGLAEYTSPETSSAILGVYADLNPAERQLAVQTLSSRKEWASALLDAVEAKRIPRIDLSAFTARQLRELGDDTLTTRVNALWGEVRETSAERAKLIADYKKKLTPEVLARTNMAAGEALFKKTCANCHKFFGEGGTIGPDITGSQRSNLDYMLENIVDPSAAVAKDFQMEIFATISGRTVTGLVIAENDAAVTIQTATDKVVLPLNEIEQRKQSTASMMPDGLLNTLSFEQIRDLIAYMQQR